MSKRLIKKAIFPIAGLATRFLPESKSVSKELIPLADKPLFHYNIQEAVNSGIEDIMVITRPKQKAVLEYFKEDKRLRKILEDNKRPRELSILDELARLDSKLSFSYGIQKLPTGDVGAIFQAKEFIKNDPCGVFFCDDIVDSDIPCFEQLQEMYDTCKRPVLALMKMPQDRLHNYGVVKVEKIANRFYKIKEVKQKPKQDAPSDLAIMGRMILTPDVFEYIKKNKDTRKKDFSITQVLGEMAMQGKTVYGCEIKGTWLECGDKPSWFKSFIFTALKHPEYGEEIKNFIKGLKI